MSEENSSRSGPKAATDNHIPPPTDPYVTYQTPYPRQASQEVQNPFIEFRRLADSAFSSLFAGLPKLLGTENFKAANIKESEQEYAKLFDEQAKQFESRIAEMVRLQTEEAEGFQKRFEQMWEERRRENEKRIDGENQRWEMMRRGLERCPGLQPDNSAALDSQQKEPATELDLYDGLKAYESAIYKPISSSETNIFDTCPWKDEKIDKKCPWNEETSSKSWLSKLGYDGRRRARNIPLYVPDKQEDEQKHFDWRKYNDEEMDPFSNDDHVVPWLKFSPYSPLALMDNDTWIAAFNQSRPSFVAGSAISDFPYEEAFEDLVSLHKNNELSNPFKRLFYWDGPSQWISDMAARGSLGEHWDEKVVAERLSSTVNTDSWRGLAGLSQRTLESLRSKSENALVQAGERVKQADAEDDLDEADSDNEFDRWEDVVRDALEPQMLQAYRQMEEVALTLLGEQRNLQRPLGARGMLWPAPEEVISALSEGRSLTPDVDEGVNRQNNNGASKTVKDNLQLSSTVSTSLQTPTGNDRPESLISTFTTTTTRTLPDGSVETKRTLKKSFADGTEEKSESMEIRPAPTNNKISQNTQTVTDGTRGGKGTSGWFWN